MKKIFKEFNTLDKSVLHIMKPCLKFSYFLLIFVTVVLFTYEIFYAIPNLFYIGISLFSSSLYFIVACLICGLSFNKIKKELKQ